MSGLTLSESALRSAAIILLGVALPVMAADNALAVWAYGEGTLDGATTAAATVVAVGQVVEAGLNPVRLELIGFAGSDVILASGSVARFALESTVGNEAPSLVVQLEHGAIEVDVTGSGPYAGVVVRGAALETRATGAEFILERGSDLDYVALAKGLLLVRLRAGLATTDGMAIQLQARQGLAGSDKGLSEVDQLHCRPQLDHGLSIQEQTAEASSDGDWSHDEAALATADPPEDGTLTSAPEAPAQPRPTTALIGDRRPMPDRESPTASPGGCAANDLCATPCAEVANDVTTAVPIDADDLRAAAGARGAAVYLR